MEQPTKLIFLPGAGGSPQFWEPVSQRLAHPAQRKLLGWPGHDPVPADPRVQGLEGLVELVVREMDQPCCLIAQSMGGVVAVHAALQRRQMLTHLVLAATSGGVDMTALRGQDWRPAFFAANPTLPRWLADYRGDLTEEFRSLRVPTLLLWGDADTISPPAVGVRLNELLVHSSLQVLPGGGHDLANRHADQVAPLIDTHLRA